MTSEASRALLFIASISRRLAGLCPRYRRKVCSSWIFSRMDLPRDPASSKLERTISFIALTSISQRAPRPLSLSLSITEPDPTAVTTMSRLVRLTHGRPPHRLMALRIILLPRTSAVVCHSTSASVRPALTGLHISTTMPVRALPGILSARLIAI